jgi:hypothetical protein
MMTEDEQTAITDFLMCACCRSRFTFEQASGYACPTCASIIPPIDIRQQFAIDITASELFLLTSFAVCWAEEYNERFAPKPEEDPRRVVKGIIGAIRQQVPSDVPLMPDDMPDCPDYDGPPHLVVVVMPTHDDGENESEKRH